MTIRINNIKIQLDDEIGAVREAAAQKVNVDTENMKNFRILKESVDARKKGNIHLVYHAEFECENEEEIVSRAEDKDVILGILKPEEELIFGNEKLSKRPVIVGSGPAGIFAGLVLAQNGYSPLILERGGSVDDREKSIDKFWQTGDLDVNSNMQFGEGGAGTFSDGKLTTRTKDSRGDFILNEFVKAGAPEEILYSGKPHIGTDNLRNVVKNIRNEIINLGGEFKFNSKVTDIKASDAKIQSVTINDECEIPTDAVILAIGHSARDTYEMLLSRGAAFEQKPFAIGVRIEHLQSMIDKNQYGNMANHPKLRAADYKLTYTSEKYKRGCYSFCMCPGGLVAGASSEEGKLVTNGMSEYKRDRENGNSAIVVTVTPDDFNSTHPLAGVEFQRHYESLAYKAGGENYAAPVQLVGDFLNDRVSTKLGNVKPSYTNGYKFASMKECLPDYVVNVIKEALIAFNRKIRGFASNDAILTGIETRTSAPVRILRGDTYESISIKGLYPSGEGAGYAGGIMSAAVDGIKTAEKIMQKYAPIK